MLHALAPGRICKRSRDTVREEAVVRVIAEMRSRLNEPLSLKCMADVAYFSPFHFNRVFKELTGVPPIQFLYALRLERAKDMLRVTDLSVTNICLEVGYNSLGSFTNRFTELVGLSPNAYRKFSREFRDLDIHAIRALFTADKRNLNSDFGVAGNLRINGCADRLVFIGLFSKSKFERWPVTYQLMSKSGSYRFAHHRSGRYHVFAIGLPVISKTMDFLTLTNAYRGKSERFRIEAGAAAQVKDLKLIPASTMDPPILGVVPLLLISGLLGQNAPTDAKCQPIMKS